MSGETPPNFDVYAHAYDALLQDSLEVTGEQKEYFARGRVEWLELSPPKLPVGARIKLLACRPNA